MHLIKKLKQVENCIRVKLTVSLVCETYIASDANKDNVTRKDLKTKIIYSSTSKLTKQKKIINYKN